MIRCKVTLAGVVNKAATTHEGKDGKPFVSFGVNLPLGDKNGNVREFNVGVTASSELVMAGLVVFRLSAPCISVSMRMVCISTSMLIP